MKALYILAALAVTGPAHAQPIMRAFDTINGVSYDCPGDPRCFPAPATPAPPHRYTVAEIDRMRNWLTTAQCGSATCGTSIVQIVIEARLAAYIAAGITAEELERAP